MRRDGLDVRLFEDAPQDLSKFDCVIFPVLTQKFSRQIVPWLPLLKPKHLIFGGKFSPEHHENASAQGIVLRDYLLREELAIANAVPTAEGALQRAMEHLPITIHSCRILIAGFGRIGQCTAHRFRALGAEVTVLARAPGQLALAESMGCRSLSLSDPAKNTYDLILNTVPSPIFTREVLQHLNAPLLLELASAPGGFDPEAVHELGLRLVRCEGLPGAVAPVTAARAIQKTIYRMLEEIKH